MKGILKTGCCLLVMVVLILACVPANATASSFSTQYGFAMDISLVNASVPPCLGSVVIPAYGGRTVSMGSYYYENTISSGTYYNGCSGSSGAYYDERTVSAGWYYNESAAIYCQCR